MDVVGLQEGEATELLRADGFRVITAPTESKNEDLLGTVKSQKPEAGSEAKPGSGVRLVVYQAPPEPQKLVADAAMQESIFGGTLESSREDLINNMESITESVDRFEYDAAADAVRVDGTSGYATDEYVADEAWELTRHLAQLWSDDFWEEVNRTEDWFPALYLTLNNLSYACPGDVMDRLADRRLSRSEWESACRA